MPNPTLQDAKALLETREQATPGEWMKSHRYGRDWIMSQEVRHPGNQHDGQWHDVASTCPINSLPGDADFITLAANTACPIIRTLLAVVQQQHEALKDVVESVAVTESMGEICQKDDFKNTRAAIELVQPWIGTQGGEHSDPHSR